MSRWQRVKHALGRFAAPLTYLLVCVVGVGGAWINSNAVDQIRQSNTQQCMYDNRRDAEKLAALLEVDKLLARNNLDGPINTKVIGLLRAGFANKNCDL